MRTRVYRELLGTIPYEIRKMRQARRMSLKISAEGKVWVSIPPHASVHQARAFIRQHRAYVVDTLRKVHERKSTLLDSERELLLPVRGIWLPVEISQGEGAPVQIHEGEPVRLCVPEFVDEQQVRRHAIWQWQNFMIHQANDELPERTMHFARSLNEPLRRIAVRDQKTRWGSCSKANRSINLNWRCVLFPFKVRDYLILHEMAHLHHANHSADFWNLVERWDPDYRNSEDWIDTHGQAIMDVSRAL